MSKINALYWECYSCEFTTPRHPDTKKKQMGKCPKCSADAWMKRTADVQYQLHKGVRDYLKEIETQSPIVHTSHWTLIKLSEKYGKDEVRKEIDKQLASGQGKA